MHDQADYLLLQDEIVYASRLHASGMRPGDTIRRTYDAFSGKVSQAGCIPLVYFIMKTFDISLGEAKDFVAGILVNACRERFSGLSEYESWIDVILHDDVQRELEARISLAAAARVASGA